MSRVYPVGLVRLKVQTNQKIVRNVQKANIVVNMQRPKTQRAYRACLDFIPTRLGRHRPCPQTAMFVWPDGSATVRMIARIMFATVLRTVTTAATLIARGLPAVHRESVAGSSTMLRCTQKKYSSVLRSVPETSAPPVAPESGA